MKDNNILITGACGQLGFALYQSLRRHFPDRKIIASDIRSVYDFEHFEYLDITRRDEISQVISKHNVGEIYHLAAILSAKAEGSPMHAWNINMSGLLHILQASVDHGVQKIFYPSSIAVFGNFADHQHTGQFEVQHPTTLYGISKSAGENWCQYFHEKYKLDVRSLRYPGVIGPDSLPGGGTTDYAVHIYHEALKSNSFTCYLREDATLPMIYIDDALRATLELMEAPEGQITVRTSYNIAGMSFSPSEIAHSIRKHHPQFQMKYQPDHRQAIAQNWPRSIDDSMARKDWSWRPDYDLDKMTQTMLQKLST